MNVHRMIAEGDLDHRYYEYPGLFFYVLWRRAARGRGHGADPARGLSRRARAWSPPSAWPRWRCSSSSRGGSSDRRRRRFSRPRSSPCRSSPCRPRTPSAPTWRLQALYLLAFIALLRLDGSAARDAWAGAALGAAAAVKFSGVFLVPALVAARLLVPAAARGRARRPRPSSRRAVFVARLAVLGPPLRRVRGGRLHAGLVPLRGVAGAGAREVVPADGRALPRGLGEDPGRAGGRALPRRPVDGLRAPRRWGPLLLVPALAIAVFATSQVRHDRFLLPAMVVGFALAAAGWERCGRCRGASPSSWPRSRSACPCWPPSTTSATSRAPAPADRAVDWAAARAAGGHAGADPPRPRLRRAAGRGLPRCRAWSSACRARLGLRLRDRPRRGRRRSPGCAKRATFEPARPLRRPAHHRLRGPERAARPRAPSRSPGPPSPRRRARRRCPRWSTATSRRGGAPTRSRRRATSSAVELGRAGRARRPSSSDLDGDAALRGARAEAEIRAAAAWTPAVARGAHAPGGAAARRRASCSCSSRRRPRKPSASPCTRGSGRRWGMAELTVWQGAP